MARTDFVGCLEAFSRGLSYARRDGCQKKKCAFLMHKFITPHYHCTSFPVCRLSFILLLELYPDTPSYRANIPGSVDLEHHYLTTLTSSTMGFLNTTAFSVGSSSEPQPEQQSIEFLKTEHRDAFSRAVSNVLTSPIAEITYGQVIDGLPLSEVSLDTHEGTVCPGHPLLDKRFELSPGVLEQARQLRTSFDATLLRFDTKVSDHLSRLAQALC